MTKTTTLRLAALALSLLAATAAWAQSAYDPKVAYTQVSGNTQYLVLANVDGTHAVRVATVGRDANGFPGNIHGVDFAPGGGRIAYSDAGGLTVLSYTASNAGIKVDRRDLLVPAAYGTMIGPPDFSSDGSRILYGTNTPSWSFRAIGSAGGSSVLLYDGPYAGPSSSVRWLRPIDMGNAFAFLTPIPSGPGGPTRDEIWYVLLDPNDAVTSFGPMLSTATQPFNSIQDFDTARTRNALLISAQYPTSNKIVELEIGGTGTVTEMGASGTRVHYSANDSRIVSITPHVAAGDYVNSLDPGTGVITHLTKKGSYGATDAQP